MRRDVRKQIKRFIPESLISQFVKYRALGNVIKEFGGRHKRECPICGYNGYFFGFGAPFRYDCVCPKCRSVERHRQHFLLVNRFSEWIDHSKVLHFAAEACFVEDYKRRAKIYIRADYFAGPDETKVDIRKMQFASDEFDTIFCHQIMEHVDDEVAALSELFRVLRPGGVVLLSTPVVETWDASYENPSIQDFWGRDLHFGQNDHVRVYGHDFRDLVRSVGFVLEEDVAKEPAVSRYSLIRGETIFIAKKPSDARRFQAATASKS